MPNAIMDDKEPEQERLIQAYLKWVAVAKAAPTWVFQFTEATKFSKNQFYEFFSDIEDLETRVWDRLFFSTVQILENDITYPTYTIREKLLAFYYTLLEVMYEEREALIKMLGRSNIPGIAPGNLRGFRNLFRDYTHNLVKEGIESGEIAPRFMLRSQYPKALWQQCLFLLRFWKNDHSRELGATDEAVERAVNLGFDVMAFGALDSLLGFGKFLYQNRKES